MTPIRTFIELGRIHLPAGTMILFWPYAWSLTITARNYHTPAREYFQALLLGYVGSALLHSGGCVWNDIVDKDLDAQVERTRGRPLPSGRITVPEALTFLLLHIIALWAIVRNLNPLAQQLAYLTMFPLTGLYPYMKRFTWFPQAWLGVTLNVPVMIAPAILLNKVTTASIILAAGGWMWTMWYDTTYACQDRKDDKKAGIKSVVAILGEGVRGALLLFASALVTCLAISGTLSGMGWVYYVFGVGSGAAFLLKNWWVVDLDRNASCLRSFENNAFEVGPAIFAGCLADYYLGLTL